ncbi:hypothetical protein D3C84_523460 [compost metagenome]
MNEDFAIGADDEGVAVSVEVQRVDDRADVAQVDVGTGHADHLVLMAYRGGHGDHQLARGRGDVGFGDDGLLCAVGGLVPATAARVVVRCAITGRHRKHHAVGTAEVAQLEVAGVRRQVDRAFESVQCRAVDGHLLGQRLQQLHAAFQPGLDVAGGQAAEFLHRGFGTVAQGFALAIVVEQDETSECDGHHEGGSQQNLVAELHVSGHG